MISSKTYEGSKSFMIRSTILKYKRINQETSFGLISHEQSNLLNNIISDSQLTSTANLRDHQVVKPVYQRGPHFQDHCSNAQKDNNN